MGTGRGGFWQSNRFVSNQLEIEFEYEPYSTLTTHRQPLPPPLPPPPPPPPPVFCCIHTQNMEWNSIGQGDESGVDLFTRTVARRRSGAGASAGAAASDGAAAMELPFDLIPGQLVRKTKRKKFYNVVCEIFAVLTLLS